MLIFILQTVWLYISELAGKELELDVLLKFFLYVIPRTVILVLPLTILLSSIMVFGNFAENYEFAAMKSTGISLQRVMKSLSIFIFGLAITTFFFANNVAPTAELKFDNLRRNIAKVKPAAIIAEGQFNAIGDQINIKVDEKSGDRGQYFKNVTIHKKKARKPGNYTVIVSKTGELISSLDSDILQLVLYDGNYYDDLQPKDIKARNKKPHIKSYFEDYTLNIDLSHLSDVDFESESYSTKHSMLTINDLDVTIDSLLIKKEVEYAGFSKDMYTRSLINTLNTNIEPNKKDSVDHNIHILDLFDTRQKAQLLNQSLNSIKSTNNIINSKKDTFVFSERKLNKHIMSFYDKFALGVSCIILFFIGAPLGALIKKGGMGLPVVIAIILFLTYHFIGLFAKNSAEDSSLNPVLASWLSTLIMFPISIYLTNRATKDRSLFSLDGLLVPFRNLISSNLKNENEIEIVYLETSEEYILMSNYSTEKLIDLIKNYRQYGLESKYKYTSLKILQTRGISKEELHIGGNLINENYENALRYKKMYGLNSKAGFKLYITALFFDIIGPVLSNNGFPIFGLSLLVIGLIATFFYLLYFIKSFINLNDFYKIGNKGGYNIFTMLLLGIPFYFLTYIYYNKKLKEDLKQIN